MALPKAMSGKPGIPLRLFLPFLVCIQSFFSPVLGQRPVVIIGWDGATWEILDPLLDQGRLPHLASLMGRGRAGILESTPCFVSPPAWAAIYTGKNPAKTGIYHFGRREDDLPHLGDLSGDDVRAKWLWEILSAEGRSCAVVNVPLTYPAKAINGICISGEFSPCILAPPLLLDVTDWGGEAGIHGAAMSASTFLHETEVDLILRRPRGGTPTITVRNAENGLFLAGPEIALNEWAPWFEVTVGGERGWARITLRSVHKTKVRLWLSPVYRKIEHMPGPITFPAAWADTLLREHHYFLPFVRWNWKPAVEHTTWFGDLCSDVQSRRRWDFFSCVFLAPDHMQHLYGDDEKTIAVLEEVDRVTGDIIRGAPENALILLLSDHGFARYERRIDLNSWLAELGLTTFGNHEEVLPESSLAWSTMWSVYLNERLLSQAEISALQDRLVRLAPTVTDAERGFRSLGLLLSRREDVYHGPFLRDAPHLVAITQGSPYVPEFWDRKNIGSGRALYRDTGLHDSWDHALDGIIVVAGSGVRQEEKRFRASVYDVTPTVLSYAGLPVADDMDGNVLTNLFESGTMARVKTCESYEGPLEEPAMTPRTGSLEDRLRALGYVR